MKTNKNAYQLVIVFAPKLAEKEKEGVLAKVKGLVTKLGAKVEKVEDLGTKELEYLIKKHNKGEFTEMLITTEVSFKYDEITLFLNREPTVIRYLVLKK